jgi:hypothetical protein
VAPTGEVALRSCIGGLGDAPVVVGAGGVASVVSPAGGLDADLVSTGPPVVVALFAAV